MFHRRHSLYQAQLPIGMGSGCAPISAVGPVRSLRHTTDKLLHLLRAVFPHEQSRGGSEVRQFPPVPTPQSEGAPSAATNRPGQRRRHVRCTRCLPSAGGGGGTHLFLLGRCMSACFSHPIFYLRTFSPAPSFFVTQIRGYILYTSPQPPLMYGAWCGCLSQTPFPYTRIHTPPVH